LKLRHLSLEPLSLVPLSLVPLSLVLPCIVFVYRISQAMSSKKGAETPKKETKAEPKKEEPKKEAPKKEAPKKDAEASKKVAKAEPKKDAPKKDVPKKDVPKKDAPKAEPKKVVQKKVEPKKVAPKRAAPKKVEAKKAAPEKTESTPMEGTEQKTNPVPETLLKKRRTRDTAKLLKEKHAAIAKKKQKTTRRIIFKRAEQYIKEYRNIEKSLVFHRRQAKKAGNFYLEPEAKLAFVIRLRGTMGLHPKPRKILALLRLRQVNQGTFVRLTKATKQMLTLVEPYITYGYPNQKAVRELIYKRGFAKVDGQRIAITNNRTIEGKLGKHNILCVEDLIHEIFTVGPHFKQANKFLWPFKLSCPTGGWKKTLTHYNEGGDSGNREDKINELIHRMN